MSVITASYMNVKAALKHCKESNLYHTGLVDVVLVDNMIDVMLADIVQFINEYTTGKAGQPCELNEAAR